LRKDSSAPEPKILQHDSGNNRVTITANNGSSGSTGSSPEAVTRKGSEERRPHTARERNTSRELEPTNSAAAAEDVDIPGKGNEGKKPSVRMVVDALEVRLSEVYNIKNLATPRTGKDSPYSARRPSTSRASLGKHASTRGSAVPSPRSARGAGVTPSAGQGNNWADLDEESLAADEMPEAFIESGEEEALDCFQQEEAGPFFVASPLLTSEGNNEGNNNNMNSGM
jgi:hypothetical protein